MPNFVGGCLGRRFGLSVLAVEFRASFRRTRLADDEDRNDDAADDKGTGEEQQRDKGVKVIGKCRVLDDDRLVDVRLHIRNERSNQANAQRDEHYA